AISALNTTLAKRVGEAVRRLAELTMSDDIDLASILEVEDRRAARLRRGPAIAHVDADVVALWNAPMERPHEGVIIANVGQHRRPSRSREGFSKPNPGQAKTSRLPA